MNSTSIWLVAIGILALAFGWNEIRDSGGARVSETTRRWREQFGGSEETRRARRWNAPLSIAVGIFLLVVAAYLQAGPFVDSDGIVRIDRDSSFAEEVRTTAQAQLPVFRALWNGRDATPGYAFSVKRPFQDGETVEHMWIDVVGIDGDVVSGTIGNDPVDVTNVALGDSAETRMEEIEDWAVFDAEWQPVAGGFLLEAMR